MYYAPVRLSIKSESQEDYLRIGVNYKTVVANGEHQASSPFETDDVYFISCLVKSLEACDDLFSENTHRLIMRGSQILFVQRTLTSQL